MSLPASTMSCTRINCGKTSRYAAVVPPVDAKGPYEWAETFESQPGQVILGACTKAHTKALDTEWPPTHEVLVDAPEE